MLSPRPLLKNNVSACGFRVHILNTIVLIKQSPFFRVLALPSSAHFILNVKCVPPYHRPTASPGTLSTEPCQSSSAVAAAAERDSYQAASTTSRFASWSSFEGKPGKMSRCLTDLTFVICYLNLRKGLENQNHCISWEAVVWEEPQSRGELIPEQVHSVVVVFFQEWLRVFSMTQRVECDYRLIFATTMCVVWEVWL